MSANFNRFSITILAILAAIVVGAVIWTGVPLSFGGLNIGGQRTDVVVTGESAQLVSQDASKRAILLIPRTADGVSQLSACAEPPPDIAQNLAQSLDASLKALGRGGQIETEAAGQITTNIQTAAELLFKRSQGIQLLRDTMFRLCEAYQNRAISEIQYAEILISLINTANFIIPFEQCTRMVSDTKLPENVYVKLLEQCLVESGRYNARREGYIQQ